MKDASGEPEQRFDGYAVRHSLKLAFDFDRARLADCLAAPMMAVKSRTTSTVSDTATLVWAIG